MTLPHEFCKRDGHNFMSFSGIGFTCTRCGNTVSELKEAAAEEQDDHICNDCFEDQVAEDFHEAAELFEEVFGAEVTVVGPEGCQPSGWGETKMICTCDPTKNEACSRCPPASPDLSNILKRNPFDFTNLFLN